jgi:hypothetical protein
MTTAYNAWSYTSARLQDQREERRLFLPLLAVIGYLIIAVYNMVPLRDLSAPKQQPDG